jgi:endoglucanase
VTSSRRLRAIAVVGVLLAGCTSGTKAKRPSPPSTPPVTTPTKPPPTTIIPPSPEPDPLAALATVARPAPSLAPPPPLDAKVSAWRGDSAVVAVSVTPPDGATEMQVAFDPTFAGQRWFPAQSTAEAVTTNTGFLEVFARFRATPTDTPVATIGGVTVSVPPVLVIDSATEVATVSRITDRRIQIVVNAGRIERHLDGPVEKSSRFNAKAVIAKDVSVVPADAAAASKASSESAREVKVASQPTDIATTSGEPLFARQHTIWIDLRQPMKAGAAYQITIPGIAPFEFTFREQETWSPAVQANQVAYRSDDPKSAFLGASLYGELRTDFSSSSKFNVIDTATGAVAFSGKPTRRELYKGGEVGHGDLTGSDVWELDFSALQTNGQYRVCVESVGCSHSFTIDKGEAFKALTATIARAVFRQRSGIPMAPPYSAVARPDIFGENSEPPTQASETLAESANGLGGGSDPYPTIRKAATSDPVPAWGGHRDAGDWDERVQHLFFLRSAIDLVTQYPETFANLDLQIPESGDAIPDLIDEGLWSLDFYLRMQRADGAIRGGLEFEDSPQEGQTSWTTKQKRFVYSPDAWSSYIFAGVAAQTAYTLRGVSPERAARYRDAAVRAAEWALAQPISGTEDIRTSTDAQRIVAAAALYQLTGEPRWQDEFASNNSLVAGNIDYLECHRHEWCDAAWIYARTTNQPRRSDALEHATASFASSAKASSEAATTTLYRWTLEDPRVPLIWGLGPSTPKTYALWRSSLLSPDKPYFADIARSVSFSLGGNPINTTFVSGIGHDNPLHPLMVDVIHSELPQWPGISVFGFHGVRDESSDKWFLSFFLRKGGEAAPDANGWPYLWSWTDQPVFAPHSEFTVQASQTEALVAYGVAAGRATTPVT